QSGACQWSLGCAPCLGRSGRAERFAGRPWSVFLPPGSGEPSSRWQGGGGQVIGRHRLIVPWLLGASLVAYPYQGAIVSADSCGVRTVAADTSLASTVSHMGVHCGEAGGETFLAGDTLIRSVAVWRLAAQTPYGGHLKLWITEADSAGVPQVDRKI